METVVQEGASLDITHLQKMIDTAGDDKITFQKAEGATTCSKNAEMKKKMGVLKPTVPKKSELVLAFAEELIQAKQRVYSHERSHSDSEIYDDILSFKEWSSDIYDDILSLTKQESETEISKHNRQGDDKEKFQTTPCIEPCNNRLSLQPSSYEDIYDDIVVYRMTAHGGLLANKPSVPPKPSHLYCDPRVQRMLQLQIKKHSMDIEEIYDTVVSLAPVLHSGLKVQQANLTENPPEVYVDPASIFQDDDDETETNDFGQTKQNLDYEIPSAVLGVSNSAMDTNPNTGQPNVDCSPSVGEPEFFLHYELDDEPRFVPVSRKTKSRSTKQGRIRPPLIKYATLPPLQQLPSGRTIFDPLPDLASSQGNFVIPNIDSDEEYEELALYEDLQNHQQENKEYEDLDKTVVEALDLPKQMRERANRLLKGKDRTKLRRSIKQWKIVHESHLQEPKQDGGEKMDSEDIRLVPCTSELESESEPQLSNAQPATIGTTSQDSVFNKVLGDELEVAETEKGNVFEDDEADDEEIPFGKSRQVFEMLLDASGIKRIPSSSLTSVRHSLGDLTHTRDGFEVSATSQHKASQSPSNSFLETIEFEQLRHSMSTELKEYQKAGAIYLRSRSEIEEEIKMLTESAPTAPPPLPGVSRPRASHLVQHKQNMLRRGHSVENS